MAIVRPQRAALEQILRDTSPVSLKSALSFWIEVNGRRYPLYPLGISKGDGLYSASRADVLLVGCQDPGEQEPIAWEECVHIALLEHVQGNQKCLTLLAPLEGEEFRVFARSGRHAPYLAI